MGKQKAKYFKAAQLEDLMQTAKLADNKIIVLFHPQEKKPCSRSTRQVRSALRFSEALAKCRLHHDIVAGLCDITGQSPSYLSIEAAWPWLKKQVGVPCGCRIVHPSVLMTICHLYDRHVTDLKDWSMSELVEWTTRTQEQMEGQVRRPVDRVILRSGDRVIG
jgi:hypothetical protein